MVGTQSGPPAQKRRRRTQILLCTAAAFVALTAIGTLFHFSGLLRALAIPLIGAFLVVFAFADRILRALKRIQEDLPSSSPLRTISNWPIQAALFVRAAALSAAEWVADFYVAACQGHLGDFVHNVPLNAMLSVMSALAAGADASYGKSIREPGLPTRAMSIFGFVSFYRNMFILSAAGDPNSALVVFFNNPLWFLDRSTSAHIIAASYLGFPQSLVVFLALPLILLFASTASLKSNAGDNAEDRHNLDVAVIILAVWVLPLGIHHLQEFIGFFL